jgi:hypothetical protein
MTSAADGKRHAQLLPMEVRESGDLWICFRNISSGAEKRVLSSSHTGFWTRQTRTRVAAQTGTAWLGKSHCASPRIRSQPWCRVWERDDATWETGQTEKVVGSISLKWSRWLQLVHIWHFIGLVAWRVPKRATYVSTSHFPLVSSDGRLYSAVQHPGTKKKENKLEPNWKEICAENPSFKMTKNGLGKVMPRRQDVDCWFRYREYFPAKIAGYRI